MDSRFVRLDLPTQGEDLHDKASGRFRGAKGHLGRQGHNHSRLSRGRVFHFAGGRIYHRRIAGGPHNAAAKPARGGQKQLPHGSRRKRQSIQIMGHRVPIRQLRIIHKGCHHSVVVEIVAQRHRAAPDTPMADPRR